MGQGESTCTGTPTSRLLRNVPLLVRMSAVPDAVSPLRSARPKV
jgi:hypothetical protein